MNGHVLLITASAIPILEAIGSEQGNAVCIAKQYVTQPLNERAPIPKDLCTDSMPHSSKHHKSTYLLSVRREILSCFP